MQCKICQSSTKSLFTTSVLQKYKVEYYQCNSCNFIQTERPYWLDEAYGNAITKLDIGLIYRNQLFSTVLEKLILANFNSDSKFLDYGGGYGMFVRMMRDLGFNFFRQDIYCENLFAEYFDITDIEIDHKAFEITTAFEVFEHLENPLSEIEKMLFYSDTIIFSTELQPSTEIKHVDDWWYFIPETGQHIAMYHIKSLEKIAEYFQMNLYSNGSSLHMITKKHFDKNPLINQIETHPKKDRLLKRLFSTLAKEHQQLIANKKESLLMKDFAYIKSLLK